jgi:hypothetical protein
MSVTYRLGNFLLLPAGVEPRAVPGPVEQGEVRNTKSSSKTGERLEQLEFKNQTFVPAPTFNALELRELLELYDKNNRGATSLPSQHPPS